MIWSISLLMVGLRSAFHSINLSPLPFICTYVQLFACRAGAHHVWRRSSRVGIVVGSPCDRLETTGENKCDALPWGSC
jgi:hypothetical protein